MNITERVMRGLLRLMPASFRVRYGAEFLDTHRRRLERAAERGHAAVLVLYGRELAGGVVLVARLWVDAVRGWRPAGDSRARVRGRWTTDSVAQDVRFAGRTLLRSRSYTATAVLVVALGVGASTAIFSAVNAFFFRPLPFSEAERLVMLYETNPEFGWVDAVAAPANMLDWREQVDAFADVAAYSESVERATYVRDGEPVLIGTSAVTGNFFSVLGTRPALGRTFRWEETWEAERTVVVLSHALWLTHFGGAADVIGRTFEVGGQLAEVVGVMPEGFNFPAATTQLWYPWGWTQESRDAAWFRRAHFVRPVARLEPGVTLEEADAQLQGAVRRLQLDHPATNSVMGAGMMPARDFLIRDVRRPLLILFGAVGLLLLLACANVANLTLVRGASRSREMALRHALGAGRLRVARQLLTESLVVAMAGGVIGAGLGWAGVRVMEALSSLGIEGATSIALDARVLLFALGATIGSGVLFGLAPAIRSTGGPIHGALIDGGTGASPGRGGVRTVRALVAAEVALALLLVMAAGLMTRSFLLMRNVDPGFRTEGALAVQFTVPAARYADRDNVLALQDRMIEALEARPGVERAGMVAQLPLTGSHWSSQFQAAGWPPERVGFEILHRRADAGYFEALGIPLIRGRLFERRDRPDGPRVVVINEMLAREHFPGENPVGQRIAYDRAATESSTWYEIIGVVADQHQDSPARAARAEVFENRHQDWGRTVWVVLRTTAEPMSMLPVVRDVLRELDPLIPIAQARPLREVWRASMAREEFILTLLTAFGVLALLLAAVGVYAVTAQAARRRTREIGIRIALGARTFDVLRLMLGQSLAVVAIGLAVGLAVSTVAGRTLASMLYGITPTDPITLGLVVAVLALVASVACYLPARRATTLDPVQSLRQE